MIFALVSACLDGLILAEEVACLVGVGAFRVMGRVEILVF